jgi:hypothetical protein
MKKIWSISTTLRSPERLRGFLIVLKKMEGEEWTKSNQIKFQTKLIQDRVYGFSSTQFYNGLTQAQIDLIEDIAQPISFEQAIEIFNKKNYEDPAMRGRTSYKPLEKMGLVTLVNKTIKITNLGKYLLRDDYDFGEIFFKSFLKWQYPNPVDRDFRDGKVYNLKPFVLTLHLINRVNQICKEKNIKEKGISRLEFELFALTLINYVDLEQQANTLINFRVTLEKIAEHKDKKIFIENYKSSLSLEFENFHHSHTYTDNVLRYFRITRYLYIRGGGYYIDLEPRRMVEINSLLDTFDGGKEDMAKKEYIDYISDINLPELPWETQEKLTEIYHKLTRGINDLEIELGKEKISLKIISTTNGLKDEIERLRLYRTQLQNSILKRELSDISKIEEVIDKLVNIRHLDLKPSIALEKYITMALNIINDAKDIKANSKVGDDNEFIFTAPANQPDIECYYDNFNSICEVTTLTSRDQWHNEGQPVMRHFRDFENNSEQDDNYCLFVAPKIHRDTINTYWTSVKYEYEGSKQKIVPFTIDQIIGILGTIKEIKISDQAFSHLQFQKLLDDIIDLTGESKHSDDWLRQIPECIENWKSDVI